MPNDLPIRVFVIFLIELFYDSCPVLCLLFFEIACLKAFNAANALWL
jgi:hypothetical protein